MTKTMTWHISASGKPARCRAFLRTCPRTHFTTNDSGRVVDNPHNVDTGSSSYGSFTPDSSSQGRLQDEVSISKAVEKKDFNAFAALSDRKKQKQDKVAARQIVKSNGQSGLLSSVTPEDLQQVAPLVQEEKQQTDELKLKIQSRLQNPDWDEYSGELVSMYYAKMIEKSKAKENDPDPIERAKAVYEESYSMNMISSIMNQAEFNKEGKLALQERKIEKMIEMRTGICNKAYEHEKQNIIERSQYGGFFQANQSGDSVARVFKAASNRKVIESMEAITEQSYDDDNWGTYRDKVTLTDVANI